MFFNDVLLLVKLFFNISLISFSEFFRTTNGSEFEAFVDAMSMNCQHSAHKSFWGSAVDTVNNAAFEKFENFIFIFFNIFWEVIGTHRIPLITHPTFLNTHPIFLNTPRPGTAPGGPPGACQTGCLGSGLGTAEHVV